MARYSAGSTASGAAKGAAAGSIFGPWGAGIGAGIGGISGFFGSRSTKKSRSKTKAAEKGKSSTSGPGGIKKLPTMSKEQQKLHKEQLKGLQGKGPLADLYKYNQQAANVYKYDKNNPLFKANKKAADVYKFDKHNPLFKFNKKAADVYKFDPNNPQYAFDAEAANQNFNQTVAAPAYQQFQENVVPGISGQFRGNNLQNSTYFGGALGKAATDVQKGLDAQRSNTLYQGQQAANARAYEGFNQGRSAEYAGRNEANQRQFGAFGQQQAAQYAAQNQANERQFGAFGQQQNAQYKGYTDANKNRAQGLENILGRSTFDYMRPQAQAPGAIDQLFSAALPGLAEGGADWLHNYFKEKPPTGFAGTSGATNGANMNFIPRP